MRRLTRHCHRFKHSVSLVYKVIEKTYSWMLAGSVFGSTILPCASRCLSNWKAHIIHAQPNAKEERAILLGCVSLASEAGQDDARLTGTLYSALRRVSSVKENPNSLYDDQHRMQTLAKY
jgi:hypothetical protein